MTTNPEAISPRQLMPGMIIERHCQRRTVVRRKEISGKYGVQKVRVWFDDHDDAVIDIRSTIDVLGSEALFRVTYVSLTGNRRTTETLGQNKLAALHQNAASHGIRITSYRPV